MWSTGEIEKHALLSVEEAKTMEAEKYYGKQKRGTNLTPKKKKRKKRSK